MWLLVYFLVVVVVLALLIGAVRRNPWFWHKS